MTITKEKELLNKFLKPVNTGKIATVAKIKETYDKKIGRKVHISTITRLLRRHGWRKVLPRPIPS